MHFTLNTPGRRILQRSLLLVLVFSALATDTRAQRREDLPPFVFDPAYRSSRVYEKKAIHDGNRVAITFFNYGLLGGTGEIRGNWPKGSRDFYVGDVLPVIALEVPVEIDGQKRFARHVVTTRGPRAGIGQQGPPGQPSIFWGFEAMPGFSADEPNEKPAISTDPSTWPTRWPDQPTWYNPTTGLVEWNGFFGRGIKNADLESYFWMDDHNDGEMYSKYGFQPDSTDASRRGQGLVVKVRGLQWSQFLAQDALYYLYEVTNTSTTTYPRVAVGLTVGTLAGGDGDSQDDLAFFDQANRIVYSWDNNNSGNERQPVGYVGYAFMESPGDDQNGIDDDGDGDPLTPQGIDADGRPKVPAGLVGTDNIFEQQDFEPRTLAAGDPIILIDSKTGRRTITYVPSAPTQVVSQGITYNIGPGTQLVEKDTTLRGQLDLVTVTERNLIDEDLDGVVDEDENLHYTRRQESLEGGVRHIVTLPALRYKNYMGLARAIRNRTATRADSIQFGLLNPMIDESHDDNIDNDGDWSPLSDDVGRDGAPGTGDEGEGDGVPTHGEPNYNSLDIDESDQVGLSSFYYFTPPDALPMDNDNRLWAGMSPGFFTTNRELEAQQSRGGIDGDFIFSSGYFKLEPGETLRFSLALVFGKDLPEITNNTKTVQEIYNRNYNFARPPEIPTLQAVAGDGRVTLYWDSKAEESTDPVLGKDFEGYRIYKSTDPNFRDPEDITDVFGNPKVIAPIAQFDESNGHKGLFGLNLADIDTTGMSRDELQAAIDSLQKVTNTWNSLNSRVRGMPFWLGEDTGLHHSYVDTLVQNGRTYYYAVTAYDRGDINFGFYPAETSRLVGIREDGTVETGANVVAVVPNAPVAGYQGGSVKSGDKAAHSQGPGTGDVFLELLDPNLPKEGTVYSVSFGGGEPVASNFSVRAGDRVLVSDVPISKVEGAIFDGLRLRFRNETTRLSPEGTGYKSPQGKVTTAADPVNVTTWRYTGTVMPYDYEIRFTNDVSTTSLGDIRLGTRGPIATATQTYFNVFNVTMNRAAEFVFYEPDATKRNGRLDANEFIFIYETVNGVRTPIVTVHPIPDVRGNFDGSFPVGGDVFVVHTQKPFSPMDQFTFETSAAGVNADDAKAQLERVKAVPNPYVVSASWERPLPPQMSGRGERRIDFTHIPAGSTIRIYSVRGELVRELHHDGEINDGTVSWDVRTREGLEVAYGVYFFHVKAPGVGEKTGKLAIIK